MTAWIQLTPSDLEARGLCRECGSEIRDGKCVGSQNGPVWVCPASTSEAFDAVCRQLRGNFDGMSERWRTDTRYRLLSVLAALDLAGVQVIWPDLPKEA